jgi:hypothetical protein
MSSHSSGLATMPICSYYNELGSMHLSSQKMASDRSLYNSNSDDPRTKSRFRHYNVLVSKHIYYYYYYNVLGLRPIPSHYNSMELRPIPNHDHGLSSKPPCSYFNGLRLKSLSSSSNRLGWRHLSSHYNGLGSRTISNH